MVRALVAAGIVAVTAMVAVAAIPSDVYRPRREPVRRDPEPVFEVSVRQWPGGERRGPSLPTTWRRGSKRHPCGA